WKESCLSQDEVAFLLGTRSGTRVARYERLIRQPVVRTVFALEVVFRAPARHLFAGIYEEVERTTVHRAVLLEKKLAAGRPSPILAHKLSALRAIISAASIHSYKDQ